MFLANRPPARFYLQPAALSSTPLNPVRDAGFHTPMETLPAVQM
jgi:hypothetical protein